MAELSICFVTTFYPPHGFGGDAIHVERLAEGLAERGHRVRVVHAPTAHRVLGGSATAAARRHPGVEVVACDGGKAGVVGTYLTGRPVTYGRRLAELVRGFDVVHLLNPSLVGGPGAFGLGDGLCVYTASEHWLLCPTHHLFRYRREVCTHRTCWRCTLSYRRPPQLWRSTGLLDRSVRNIDLLISPSRFTAHLHREFFPDMAIEVLPAPGPLPRVIDAVTRGASGANPYFLFAGRLDRLKGADRLIEAFRGVTGAELWIAGEGPEDGRLRALAAGDERVRFLGPRGNEDVLSLCAGARALVVPSVGYETFGLTATEAMAVGTPVVVRDLGPLPELAEDGGGIVFGDDTALTRALQSLTDDASLARSLGDEAARVYAARFSHPVVLRGYLELLARASASRPGDLARRAAEAASAA